MGAANNQPGKVTIRLFGCHRSCCWTSLPSVASDGAPLDPNDGPHDGSQWLYSACFSSVQIEMAQCRWAHWDLGNDVVDPRPRLHRNSLRTVSLRCPSPKLSCAVSIARFHFREHFFFSLYLSRRTHQSYY